MQRKTVKLTVLLLILSLTAPVYAASYGAEAQTDYYSVDFNDNVIPALSNIVYGDGGFVFADSKALTVAASDTYPPVTSVLFPYKTEEPEYVYECDISFNRILSGGCWFSLCFGAQSENMLYQFTVKPDSSLSDSVSVLYKTSEASWQTVAAASVGEFISDKGLSKYKFTDGVMSLYTGFTLSVAVKNGSVFGYIDGVKVIEARLANTSSGYVGFNCRGVTVKVDNLKVHGSMPYSVSAVDSFGAEPYTMKTGVVAAPVIMQRDRQAAVRSSGASSVLYTVRKIGPELHSYDGAVDLGTLGSRLKAYPDTLPAFYVSDEDAASALSSYMSANFINDAFVIVSHTSLCRYFKDNRYTRIALDLSSRDGVDADDLYRLLYKNSIRTVVLSEKAADAASVTALKERFISVWVNCTADPVSAFNTALSGAECIITADPQGTVGLFESVGKTVLMRAPVVISDGGDTTAAPKYSQTAIQKAYDSGIRVIQASVKKTKDGALVLAGGDTTEGMSEECVISDTTLPALAALTYKDPRVGANERIMTLDDLLEMTAGNLKGSVIHIYVDDEESAKKAVKIASEYGVTERCVIISDDKNVINTVNALDDGAAACYSGESYIFDYNDKEWLLSALCETLTGYNSVYRGTTESVPPQFLSPVRLRGIPAYITAGKGESAAGLMLNGYDGFTVSNSADVSKYVRSLYASTDAEGRLTAKIVHFDGTELDVTALCEIIALSGEVSLSSGVITGEGTYTVVCPQTAKTGEKYYVCSAASTTSRESAAVTEETAEMQSETNRPVIIIAAAAAGVAVVGGITALTVITRKKKRLSKEKEDGAEADNAHI